MQRLFVRIVLWSVLGAVLPLACCGCGAPRRPNVLLITLDTTRTDHLGCFPPHTGYTPNLDRLARDGVVFENARTVAPLTLPAHISLMTGLLPQAHGLRINDAGVLPTNCITMAEIFRTNGYTTAAFVAAVVLDRRCGVNRGFEHFDDRLPLPLMGEAAKGDPGSALVPASINGQEVTDRALGWLKEHAGESNPWFVWVHYYDPHAPYREHAEFEAHGATNSYSQEISYMDAQIGRILKFLQGSRAGRNAWVVAVGDHGESLGEHGERTHGYTVYDGAVRIPLILKGKGLCQGRASVETAPVSIVDVLPTLTGALGLPRQQGAAAWHGQGLFHERSPNRACYFEALYPEAEYRWAPVAGCADANWKYIECPRPELYEVSRDPRETTDRALKDDHITEQMAHTMEAFRTATPTGTPERVASDAETLRRMRSLGYAVSQSVVARAADSRPARAGEARRDIKDGLSLLNDFQAIKCRSMAGTWTKEDYVRISELTRLSPETPNFHVQLGTLADAMGEDRVATNAFLQALAIDPADCEALNAYGIFFLGRGQLGPAREMLKSAIDTGGGIPGKPTAAAGLAYVELQDGHIDISTNLLEMVLPFMSETRGVWKRLGDGRNLKGDAAGALACYRNSLAQTTNWIPALESQTWTLACTGSPEQRHEALAGAYILCLSTSSQEPRDLETMAVAYAGVGKFPRAIETAERALDLIVKPAPPLGKDETGVLGAQAYQWKKTRDRTRFKALIQSRLQADLAAWRAGRAPTHETLAERFRAPDFYEDEPARLASPESSETFHLLGSGI